MYIIVDSKEKIIATSNISPDLDDCNSRNEKIVSLTESEKMILLGRQITEFKYSNSKLIDLIPPMSDELQLENKKTISKQLIDKETEKVRLKYTTNIIGQESIYLEKTKEAEKFLNSQTDYLDDFPFIKSEMNLSGLTAFDSATLILNTRKEWLNKIVNSEEIRRKGKNFIDSALTEEEILNIVNNTITQLNLV